MSEQQPVAAPELGIVTFCWGEKFSAENVTALYNALRANIRTPFAFHVVTDKPQKRGHVHSLWPQPVELKDRPKNFNRLRLFSGDAHEQFGKRIVQCDLDTVILGDMTPIVQCEEPFRIMEGTQQRDRKVCPVNGSLWVHDEGTHPELWRDLTQEEVERVFREPKHGSTFGSDQAWIAARLPEAPVFTGADGLYQYRSLYQHRIPDNARAIFFAGGQNPWSEQTRIDTPRLWKVYRCYANDVVRPIAASPKEVPCLLLGCGTNLWDEVNAKKPTGTARFGVVAFPEAALAMVSARRKVDALALNFRDAEKRARELGYTELIRCGQEYLAALRTVQVGRGAVKYVEAP